MDDFDFDMNAASKDELVDYIDKIRDTLAKMAEEKDDAETDAADLAIENARLKCKTTLKKIGSQWLKCGRCCVRFSIMFPVSSGCKVRYCPNCGAKVVNADRDIK